MLTFPPGFLAGVTGQEEKKMNLKVRFYGMPDVEKAVGGKEIDLQVEGGTFGDLLDTLGRTYGESVRKAAPQQVLHNAREWIRPDDLGASLRDGDLVSFLPMMGGG